MTVYDDACTVARIDAKRVQSIARRIDQAAREAQSLGITVFGGSGSGSLRWNGDAHLHRHAPLILADMGGAWSGGDGACMEDKDGLLRGEGL